MDAPLASLPSFHGVTRLPDADRLALWWVTDGRTTLRLLTPGGDDVGTVPTDDLTEAPAPLFRTGDRVVVSPGDQPDVRADPAVLIGSDRNYPRRE